MVKIMALMHHMKVPTVFINSVDDPIVPPPLLEIVRDAALKNPNMIFIEQVLHPDQMCEK